MVLASIEMYNNHKETKECYKFPLTNTNAKVVNILDLFPDLRSQKNKRMHKETNEQNEFHFTYI